MLRKSQWLAICLLIAAVATACGGWWRLAFRDRNIFFLPESGKAKWIVFPVPPNGYQNPRFELSTEFRNELVLTDKPAEANLAFRAFIGCEVRVNGRSVNTATQTKASWKEITRCNITEFLKAGTNELSITVSNASGPPAFWASVSAGKDSDILVTDESWQSSLVGAAWRRAQLAAKPMEIRPGNLMFGGEKAGASLHNQWPVLTGFAAVSFLVVWVAQWWARKRKGGVAGAAAVPWFAAGGIAVLYLTLWLNNLPWLPDLVGFDYGGHLQYIQYILQHHTLPLANEGWEMYQPPLYYSTGASLLSLLHRTAFDAGGVVALRLLGMVYGIATFTLVFLSLRLLFRERTLPQLAGLMLAGFLPANIYLCHYVTNEILAATMAAAAVYLCLRVLMNSRVSVTEHAVLGAVLGAALLAKSSTLALGFLIFPAIAWNLHAKGARNFKHWIGCLGAALLGCMIVAGWHYGRVAAHFGNPLVGNWDAASGFAWWQHPGYRTASYYMAFGKSLSDPFYSAYSSFADGIYSTLWGDGLWGGMSDFKFRPPWNYELMNVGYLLALPPTAAILAGAARKLADFLRNPRPEEFLLLGLPAFLGALLIYYSLKIPVYASAKAFYASAALVPLCVFGAAGWEMLVRRVGRAEWILHGLLVLWAINSYAAFWIKGDASSTRILIARNLADQQLHEEAVAQLSLVLRRDPENGAASALMATELLALGRESEAQAQAQQAIQFAPASPDSHLAFASVLVHEGRLAQAVAETKKATELAPDDPVAFDKLSERLYASGRKTEAIAACREAIRIYPANAKLHYRLAAACEDAGDTTEALTHFRWAAVFDPTFASAPKTTISEAPHKKPMP